MKPSPFNIHNLAQIRQHAYEFIRSKTALEPSVAIILGSGLGGLADDIDIDTAIHYQDIPGFASSSAPGHEGRLLLGHLAGQPVVAMQGRVHLYEGIRASQVAFPVRVMHALGASSLLVSNACGGINPNLNAGDLMLQLDYINFSGDDALSGPNVDELGPRFTVMFECYDPAYLELARRVAHAEGIDLKEGIYLAIRGPSFATRAELHMFKTLGADALGMSTVHEVAVARHEGMRVLGISSVTDVARPDVAEHASGQDIIDMAKHIEPRFRALVRGIVAEMPTS
ncbi:MAG: purine-nucleoside phosphorylase [Deinococcota bacterium]